jgi:hypothetical protein
VLESCRSGLAAPVALVMAESQWWSNASATTSPTARCDPAWLERLGLPAAALDLGGGALLDRRAAAPGLAAHA